VIDTRERVRAFLIADLAGYTALTETHGNAEAVKIIDRYVELAAPVVSERVTLVERVGDELLFTSEDLAALARAALELHRAVQREPLFPLIRSGIHAGLSVEYDGRYLGAAINITARIAAYARGGQIVCSRAVADEIRDVDGITVRALGRVLVRHVADSLELFEIADASVTRSAPSIDPVCRMQVDPETAPVRVMLRDAPLYFCSHACAAAFLANPASYGDQTAAQRR
jgi:adenylate cyclase